MRNYNLVSKCGIYCGACYIYRAQKDGGKFLDYIAKKEERSRDEIKCSGCSGPNEELWYRCKSCKFRACLHEQGYDFCFECSGFNENSCEKYENAIKFCQNRGENIRESLERIKADETDLWLEEQDEKWRCSKCGGSISWYEESCHHCNELI